MDSIIALIILITLFLSIFFIMLLYIMLLYYLGTLYEVALPLAQDEYGLLSCAIGR